MVHFVDCLFVFVDELLKLIHFISQVASLPFRSLLRRTGLQTIYRRVSHLPLKENLHGKIFFYNRVSLSAVFWSYL